MAGARVLNQPLSANALARPGGICSMFRLPIHKDTEGLDACFVGVPMDIGTSTRAGTRFGPRQIRSESVLMRQENMDTGAAPYTSLNVADISDVPFDLYNLPQAVRDIRRAFSGILSTGCRPLTMGGDHTISFPILQAVAERYGPVGLVHVDAHSDTNDTMGGAEVAHGTPFRRAMEAGALVGDKVFQIGIRGTSYSATDMQWPLEQGFRVYPARNLWQKSLVPLASKIREVMGDAPVYVSFDIDGLDPCFAPGTGTPEIGGLTTGQALELVRGLRGLNIVGADLVEVSPPYDTTGNTALTAANLLFELLCVLPGVAYKELPPVCSL